MIIIINGAIGAGKTSVSWALLEAFEQAAMLDGDYIAAVAPFSIFEPSDLEYAYRSIAELATFHFQNGYRTIIINYVFETVEELDKMKSLLALIDLPIHPFLLTCTAAERERRIRHRATPHSDLEWEIPRSNDLHQILLKSADQGDLGEIVGTTSRSLEEVVAQIMDQINNHSDGN